ncbi:hypothetical protein QN277_023792 [Acacia crassicarpa]|uniref:Uncharacterized protein n=1 Tax=Acacia crassicarpa TaxID=499986 RepID=A0AAE1MJE7_9FABA|nr:hypothetical protein QN277_023792 [Acacia crassicarpa]
MEVTGKEGKRREEEGFMADKLKRGVLVGLRAGPSTPPPTWRLELSSSSSSSLLHSGCKNDTVREFVDFPPSTISARKLCANLWELQPHRYLQIQTPLPNMNKPATRIRRRHRRRHKDKHPQRPADEPASPSRLSRHVATTLPVQSHRSVGRDGCVLEPLSPASYSGSLEVAPYDNQALTPTSSFNLKGMRMGESSCNVKTSKELVKVLNRIWRLEEHHASSMSVVKAQKMELDLSRARIKELLREKQGMEDLAKRITEDKLVRKNMKELDKINAAFRSVKEQLEDERRLRKHSESLHRKLARELSQMKSSFSASLKELERERKARILLENLCDEFAKGIRAYEQEIRSLRRMKSEKGEVGSRDHTSLDRLILHISEAWLDERAQMKLAKVGDDPEEEERSSIVDKLGFDIETFLHATRSIDSKKYGGDSSPKELKEIYPCHHSSDSFPLKEAASAPQNMAEEDSIGANFSDLKIANSSTKQVQPHDESWFLERKPSELRGDTKTALLNNEPEVSTICEATQGAQESHSGRASQMNSGPCRLDNVVGNSSVSSEGDKIHPESICREDSHVEERKSKLSLSDLNKSESLPRGVKENTLMAKLLEARLEGQKYRSRNSKSSFRSSRDISDEKIEV